MIFEPSVEEAFDKMEKKEAEQTGEEYLLTFARRSAILSLPEMTKKSTPAGLLQREARRG